MSNAPQTGQFYNVDALARMPDASVILVDEILRPDIDVLFPGMAVLGVKGSPKPYPGLRGRTVYVWLIDPDPKLPAVAEMASKVGVVRGNQSAAVFLGNPGRVRGHIQANIEKYEVAGKAEAIVEPAKAEKPAKRKLGVVDKDGAVRDVIPADDSWRVNLIRSQSGTPKPIVANAILALRNDPAWQGVLAYNEFAMQTEIQQPTPFGGKGAWSDTYDTLTTVWLQENGIHVNTKIAAEAVETVARDRSFHKVREYLDTLAWDKVPRLDRWLVDYVGAKDTEYVSVAGRIWMVSAIARARQPGVKADLALILEGPQGIGKSTVFDILGGPFFTDEIEKLGTKDASMQAMGAWVIEMSELDAMTGKAEISSVKAFLARRKDRFRPPYGRRLIEAPRQCVFGGTVNPGGSGFLRDETGNRRFLPVKAGKIDIDALRRDRDQLWAEAQTMWMDGVPHWLVDDSVIAQAKIEQDERREHDVWEDVIAESLGNMAHRTFLTMREVLTDFVHLDAEKHGKFEQRRAGAALRILGWEPTVQRDGDQVKRGWRPVTVTGTDKQADLEF